jgi:hypothetical protein
VDAYCSDTTILISILYQNYRLLSQLVLFKVIHREVMGYLVLSLEWNILFFIYNESQSPLGQKSKNDKIILVPRPYSLSQNRRLWETPTYRKLEFATRSSQRMLTVSSSVNQNPFGTGTRLSRYQIKSSPLLLSAANRFIWNFKVSQSLRFSEKDEKALGTRMDKMAIFWQRKLVHSDDTFTSNCRYWKSIGIAYPRIFDKML